MWRAVLAAVAAVIAVVGCGTARSADQQGSVPAAARAAAGRTTITIDPHAGETFAPASASAAPKLTAQQAWARYAARNGARVTMPTGVTVRLGLLTLPIGPQPDGSIAYTAHKELAYGYSSPSGCVSTLPGAVPAAAGCLSWTFLNANTGKLIDQTWQKTGHRHMPGPQPSPAAAPLPPPSPQPPAHARQVQTGPDIQQWQETGTTITSLWMDLETGMIVQITGQSLDSDPQQGEISIDVITEASAAISGGTEAESIRPPARPARSR